MRNVGFACEQLGHYAMKYSRLIILDNEDQVRKVITSKHVMESVHHIVLSSNGCLECNSVTHLEKITEGNQNILLFDVDYQLPKSKLVC